jgi:hypothetical protein
MAYLCKNLEFSSVFVLRMIKMYMEVYHHYEKADLLNFFTTTYLQHVSTPQFREFYEEYSRKLQTFLQDENAVTQALDKFFTVGEVVRRLKLLYKFKNTSNPNKPG